MTGIFLKQKLDLLGIKQRKLAELIGVTPQSINAIMTAKDVRSGTIEKIARVLDVPIAYFFDESGGSAVATGDFSAASVNGDASVSTDCQAVLKEKVKALELLVGEKDKLIEEKERTIKILLQK